MSKIPITTKGFGTMTMTWAAQPKPFSESIKTLKYAKEKYGVKFFNGGLFYQVNPKFSNLDLISQFVKETDNDIVVSVKGGLDVSTFSARGDKAFIDDEIDQVVSHFDKKPKIIFEAARVDKTTPIEETVSFIYDRVKKGDIAGISLSEVSAATIEKAASVAPISFVEVELSLFSQDIFTNGILETASKLDIPIVAYSPLARGILTDHAAEHPDFIGSLGEQDPRRTFERFTPEIFAKNKKRLDALHKYAQAKGITLELLALSYIESLSGLEDFEGIPKLTSIIPIPSASTIEKVDKNFATIKLSRKEVEEIQEIVKKNPIHGGRYNAHMESLLNG